MAVGFMHPGIGGGGGGGRENQESVESSYLVLLENISSIAFIS